MDLSSVGYSFIVILPRSIQISSSSSSKVPSLGQIDLFKNYLY